MITMKSEKPVAGRNDIWPSEIRYGTQITPARRDKLVTLLNLAGFTLRDTANPDVKELVSNGGVVKIGV